MFIFAIFDFIGQNNSNFKTQDLMFQALPITIYYMNALVNKADYTLNSKAL